MPTLKDSALRRRFPIPGFLVGLLKKAVGAVAGLHNKTPTILAGQGQAMFAVMPEATPIAISGVSRAILIQELPLCFPTTIFLNIKAVRLTAAPIRPTYSGTSFKVEPRQYKRFNRSLMPAT